MKHVGSVADPDENYSAIERLIIDLGIVAAQLVLGAFIISISLFDSQRADAGPFLFYNLMLWPITAPIAFVSAPSPR